MSTRLVILGLLRERPLYGYEIKQVIQDHMADWTSIAFGSIYFALNKLAEGGFIEKVAEEREGNRPSRSVYRITEAGETEFLRLLREMWDTVERPYYAIDIGLFFAHALPESELRTHLRQRIADLTRALAHIERHQEHSLADPEVPRRAVAVFRHALLHSRAELEWTREVLAAVESGAYGLDDGPPPHAEAEAR